MPESQRYTVYLTTTLSISVEVDAEDPEAAIEQAYEKAPRHICASCSGWGQNWSKDDSGDMEPDSVVDENGVEVWSLDAK